MVGILLFVFFAVSSTTSIYTVPIAFGYTGQFEAYSTLFVDCVDVDAAKVAGKDTLKIERLNKYREK